MNDPLFGIQQVLLYIYIYIYEPGVNDTGMFMYIASYPGVRGGREERLIINYCMRMCICNFPEFCENRIFIVISRISIMFHRTACVLYLHTHSDISGPPGAALNSITVPGQRGIHVRSLAI